MSELRATILTALRGDAAEKLAKQLDTVSVKMTNFGSVASKAVKGVASLGAALVSSKFIGDSIEQAKNLERSVLALDSVFGSVAPRMVQFSKDAVSMGLSQSEAAKASTFLGSVLQQYGFSSNEAAVETEKLTKLSADLAATYGYDVQEALLAVTALFRGEYDPIEKFGVAMKQNEINGVKAARGLDHLTGAAEMQADAQIRLELLMERSTSAQGAMERGAGTLYVETEKLRATFENLQANLGQELIPVFAELFERLRPIIEDAAPALAEIFEFVAEVVGFLGQTLTDLFDPTTMIGESFAALGNQFESLFQTIFGRDFDLAIIFEVATNVLNVFINAIHDLLRIVENVIIAFQALGIFIEAAFNRDFTTLKKGLGGIADELYSVRDAATATALQMDILYAKAAKSLQELGNQTEIWNVIGKKAAPTGKIAGEDFSKAVGGALKVEKDVVAEFWKGLTDEIAKQQARLRLQTLGLSAGLIERILGSGDEWQKVFDAVLARGKAGLKQVQDLFNQTAAGMKELEAVAERQLQWQIYQSYAYERQLAQAYQIVNANNILIEQQKELADSFKETSASILENYTATFRAEQGLGDYTSAVVELGDALGELIEANPYTGTTGLFSDSARRNLINSTNTILGAMRSIAEQRDEIGSRLETAKSLVDSISDSIFGSFNITTIQGKASDIISVFRDTVKRTREFATQLDRLRSSGLTETAIEQIIGAGAEAGSATAQALLEGGPNAIRQVNSLFGQLEGVSKQIGEGVAASMYGEGNEITNGLIEGMLSQQSALEMAAEQLAKAFERGFTGATSAAAISLTGPSVFQAMGDYDLPFGTTGVTPQQKGSGVYNITVNAGMGTNGQNVGQMIIDEIKRFERQSGRVFISA